MADKALLLGINNYRSISDLGGCLNDVDNLFDLLTSRYGFSSEDIRALKDEEVVKPRVEENLKWLFENVGEGDRVLLHFSGHGSYTASTGDDDEHDGRDELICLWDMDFYDRNSYLTDDELRTWTEQLPTGVNLTVILDCCHSGTGTRAMWHPESDAGPEKAKLIVEGATRERAIAGSSTRDVRAAMDSVARAMDPESENAVVARFVPPPPEIESQIRGLPFKKSLTRSAREMNHVLLAACRDDQTAADALLGGDRNGAFTYCLVEAADDASGDIELNDLHDQISSKLSNGSFDQIPQLEPQGVEGIFLGTENFTHVDHPESADVTTSQVWGNPVKDIDRTPPNLGRSDTIDEERMARARQSLPARKGMILPDFRANYEQVYGNARSTRGIRSREVIGSDDRVAVADPTMAPFRWICYIEYTIPGGTQKVATGWLAHPKVVITSGHVVWDHEDARPDSNGNKWTLRDSVQVYAGGNGKHRALMARAVKLTTTAEWIRQSPGFYDFDFAAIYLDTPIGSSSRLGHFRFENLNDSTLRGENVNVVGYPGGMSFPAMFGHGRPLTRLSNQSLLYDVDTSGGNSGSPVIFARSDRNVSVVGIHSGFERSAGLNAAIRINRLVHGTIQGWIDNA